MTHGKYFIQLLACKKYLKTGCYYYCLEKINDSTKNKHIYWDKTYPEVASSVFTK